MNQVSVFAYARIPWAAWREMQAYPEAVAGLIAHFHEKLPRGYQLESEEPSHWGALPFFPLAGDAVWIARI